jgi:uncharacterized protein YheU (UPF0270 family)
VSDPSATSDADESRVERDEPSAEPDAAKAGIVVPWEKLSADALRGVLEEFITREGTEYGADDVGLERKLAQVQRQLERGEVVVLFDGDAETVNLVRAAELPKP